MRLCVISHQFGVGTVCERNYPRLETLDLILSYHSSSIFSDLLLLWRT